MQTEKSYRLLPVQTEEELLEKVLIAFAKDENVAPDLLKVKFSVEKLERPLIRIIGDASTQYSCSVGYDRQESYVEMETKDKLVKQPDGSSKWEKVTTPVNKTRTITDWSPHSGQREGKYFSFLKEDGAYDAACLELKYLIENLKVEEIEEEFGADAAFLKNAKEMLVSSIEVDVKTDLPGDQYKDFRAASSAEVSSLEYWLIPYYKVSYTYNGVPYEFELKGYVEDIGTLTLSEAEKEPLQYQPLNTGKIASEKYKVLGRAGLICAGAGAVGFAFSWVSFLSWLPLAFIPAIVIAVIYYKKYKAYKDKLDEAERIKKENILTEKRKIVYAALCEGFEKNGLKTISYEQVYA